MRNGPLYQTSRFDFEGVHDRPTVPAPAPVLSAQVTQTEYDQLEEDEIEVALEELDVDSLDDGWLEVVQ